MNESTGQLTCDNLTKIYGNSKTKALDSVSFSLPSRGIFVLIGRNGSGKTTLVRILATELEPTSGSAKINGLDVVREARKLRERIAIVPQEARPIPWMTPMQTVLSYLLWRGLSYSEAKRRALETLERLGLGGSLNALNRSLSGGMRRKVMVATVLACEAEVVFMDEPTTGLDPISRREFWETLRGIGKDRFTFLTTHYLEEAEQLADQIGMLDRGNLIRIGTLDQLRKSVTYNYSIKVLSKTAGSQLDVRYNPSHGRFHHHLVPLLLANQETIRRLASLRAWRRMLSERENKEDRRKLSSTFQQPESPPLRIHLESPSSC